MLRGFFASLTFLSVIPAWRFIPSERDITRAVNFFPLAGALFGALFFGVAVVTLRFLPTMAAVAFLVVLSELFTKALHLDGLADTADAFMSGRDRPRKLEIMRDSGIGTMGVFAIVAVLGMKFSGLASLPLERISAALALMFLNGRMAMMFHIASSRYARPSGLGKLFFGSVSLFSMIFAIVLMFGCGWMLLGLHGVLAAAGSLFFAVIWSRVCAWIIGGATGDTIGCCCQLTELLTLYVFLL
ncbi:MAG: adenosylcobinamide-GDP ribazoletransferase [Victivallaceae bacterium]|nr:adenosylcobinamide-GDP ribazoletransferase [Victivallaceae bacterium]